jgi:hypothetical protein
MENKMAKELSLSSAELISLIIGSIEEVVTREGYHFSVEDLKVQEDGTSGQAVIQVGTGSRRIKIENVEQK